MAEKPLDIIRVQPDDKLAVGESVSVPTSIANEQQGIQGRIAYIMGIDDQGRLTIQLGSEKKVVDRSQLDGGRRFNPPPLPQAGTGNVDEGAQ